MSSKSIYSFDKMNKNLSTIFSIEYQQINYTKETQEWSSMEVVKNPSFGFWSSEYRESLLIDAHILNRKLRSNVKNKLEIIKEVDCLLIEINKQIGYLMNRSNADNMKYIRKLRKSKVLLIKNKI